MPRAQAAPATRLFSAVALLDSLQVAGNDELSAEIVARSLQMTCLALTESTGGTESTGSRLNIQDLREADGIDSSANSWTVAF